MPVDLIHTRLEVTPQWKNRTLDGTAIISMKAHFYPVDSFVLTGRNMIIEAVQMVQNGEFKSIPFSYDSTYLIAKPGRKFSDRDTLTLRIKYIAQPEKIKEEGSASIKSNRGLFFIDADSLDPLKPTQLWTQGETESNSGWFPTIESPQQKMTQEILITVDTAFTTVSNGLLISSVKNNNGTRTDHWKQSLPHAPYLAMIAVGNFAKVTEQWRGMEVSYYVDPPYAPFAKMIFGHTTEMLDFFSKLTGVTYPWEKYAQVVVHDYISGAMENTTAVIHGTNMQQDPRQYIDYNFEEYVAHELFHHWFGDLITCESWSNLTLNEGFANYSEYLWNEYKFGRDEAEYQFGRDMNSYINRSAHRDPPLINYRYVHREDMYNSVTYNKGGRVLHMLRKYVGDDAFFASIKHFLEKHRFGAVEIADLRLAFEKVTGEDLHWFFEQWFMQNGFPVLNISKEWSESTKTLTLTIRQEQDQTVKPAYRLPLAVDIYSGPTAERKNIVADSAVSIFRFPLNKKPDLVNVDAEKMLLCKKKVEQSKAEWIHQYFHGPLYTDRMEALRELGEKYQYGDSAVPVIVAALDDRHYNIRVYAIEHIGPVAKNDPDKVREKLVGMIFQDSSTHVRETAIYALSKYYSFNDMRTVFEKALQDSSYATVAAAFSVIRDKDVQWAIQLAPRMEKDTGSAVYAALSDLYKEDRSGKLGFFERALIIARFNDRYTILRNFETYLSNADSPELEKGMKWLSEKRKIEKSRNYRSAYTTTMKNVIAKVKSRIDGMEAAARKNEPVSKTELSALKNVYERIDRMLE